MENASPGPFERALVIANHAAGRVTEELVDEVTRRCRKWVVDVRVHMTRSSGDATSTARTAAEQPAGVRPDVILSVGGDGTVGEVVTGLTGARTAARPPLFVVPAGTGNSNYLAHWGDVPWPDALDAALSGDGCRLRRLDLARLVERDQLVLLGASSGIVAEALLVARDLALTGPARYQEAFNRVARTCVPYAGRVIVDGVVLHEGGTVLANVGGGRYRGGTYRLLPHSLLDDGRLDVCVISDAVDPARVPELVLDGSHVGLPGVFYARGQEIVVERTDGPAIWFEHDGELLDRVATSFTLQVVPGALAVLCRATGADD